MTSKTDLLLEAERRGILPENKKPLLDEARRRGLVPGAETHQPKDAPDRSDWTPGMKEAYRLRNEEKRGLKEKGMDVSPGSQRRLVQSGSFGAADEILAGVETGFDLLAGPFRGDKRSVRETFNENWAKQQADLDQMYEETGGRDLSFSDLAGGFVMTPVAAAAAAAPTLWQGSKTALKYALPTGAAARFFGSEGGVVERGQAAADPKAIAFDAGAALTLNALLHGGSALRQRSRDRRQQQVADSADLVREADQEGVNLPGFVITGNEAVQGTAAGLGNTVFGAPVRNAVNPAIERVEQRVQEEIARGAGGAIPTQQAAGQQIKDDLRYLLTERSQPAANVRELPDADLQRITGPIGQDGFLPNRQTVAPVQPRPVQDQPIEPYYQQPTIPDNPPFEVEAPRYRDVDPNAFRDDPTDLATLNQLESKTPELRQRALKEEESSRQFQSTVRSYAQKYPNAFRIVTEGGRERLQVNAQLREIVENTLSYESAINPPPLTQRQMVGGRETIVSTGMGEWNRRKKLAEYARKFTKEEYQLAEQMRDVDLSASLMSTKTRNVYERHVAEIDKIKQRMSAKRDAAIETERRRIIDEENARVAKLNEERAAHAKANAVPDAEARARRDAQVRANQETDRLRQEAAREAEEETRRIQQIADEEYRAELSRAQQNGVGQFRPGRSGETYPTDFDAAYESAARQAPRGNLGNPLGFRGSDVEPATQTRITQLLDSIATEARGTTPTMKGYKEGQLFGPDGRGPLDQRVVSHLRNILGNEVTDRLVYLADLRASGKAAPGYQAWNDLRTAIGRELGNARRGGQTPGMTQGPDEATLSRLYDAFSGERDAILRARGGDRAADMLGQIDPAYRSYLHDLRKPLSKVFGDNVNSVDALNKLVDATRPGGNADLLRSYYRVMQEKGNPHVATSYLLRHMSEGGLEGFLTSYRNLSPDARRIMFQGAAREMGESLDRLARIGSRLERFNRGRGGADSWERFMNRAASPGHVMIGLTYFISAPAAITGALGANMASRALASRWYTNWLRSAPAHLPAANTEAWRRHVARLTGMMQSNLGVSDEDAEKVAKEMMKRPELGTEL